jgi:pimeloyl-ACP methyl ester carboxylesterase
VTAPALRHHDQAADGLLSFMARRVSGWLLAAALWIAFGPALAAEPTTECRVAGLRNSVQCGMVQRLLDPARPAGPKIDVHFVVVPAIARRKLPDPVFLLAGGPGQSAIELAPAMMGLLNRLGNRRDIVFVDQRGTGRSAPLECKPAPDESLADQVDPDRQVRQLARCRGELLTQRRIKAADDLRFFTTTLAMQDLDAVRDRLGVQRVNLVGASYGTRAALEYQRQFPARVRRSVIDGVAPPDMVLPAAFAIDGQAAFGKMLDACEAEPACAADHPRLRADWGALLASLPRSLSVADPLTGRAERFELTRDMLLAVVRGPLYSPSLAAGLPAAIGEAARGNFAALMGLGTVLSSRRAGQVAMGMHFSVVCAEDIPRLARTESPSGDGADGFLRMYTRVCADWPRGEVPAAFYTVPASASPVLLLSGGLDPATPPRHGERVARALGPLAQHIVVPQAGHGVMALGCLRDVIYRFIDTPDDQAASAAVQGDTACARNIPRPPSFQPVGTGAGRRSGITAAVQR